MEQQRGVVDELFSPRQSEAARELWQDPESRFTLKQVIGRELLRHPEKILLQPSLDVLMLVCAASPFAENEQECSHVAMFVHWGICRAGSSLPSLTESPLAFATKTLVALAFFLAAMERRHTRRGAPSPSFYRRTSQQRFESCGYSGIARNHLAWEIHLAEKLWN